MFSLLYTGWMQTSSERAETCNLFLKNKCYDTKNNKSHLTSYNETKTINYQQILTNSLQNND